MSKFWTDQGYKHNVVLYLSSSVSLKDKLEFLNDYAEWLHDCIMEDVPNCDDCDQRRGDGDDGRYDAWQ